MTLLSVDAGEEKIQAQSIYKTEEKDRINTKSRSEGNVRSNKKILMKITSKQRCIIHVRQHLVNILLKTSFNAVNMSTKGRRERKRQ